MPTYEYRCDNGHSFEVVQPMAEDSLDTCTVCGAPARRVLHAPAVHFKGSGFYTTDYARKGKKAPASESGSDSSSGDSKGSENKSGSNDSSGGSSSGNGDSGSKSSESKTSSGSSSSKSD